MAAAEARAAFQRTVNRCFVQEDAKRAPRLACCQSSSSTSKHVDSGSTNAADEPDHPSIGFMPLNRNSSYSSLFPESKWWLHTQPNYGYHKIFTQQQVNSSKTDTETLKSDTEKSCTVSDIHLSKESSTGCEVDGYSESYLDVENGISDICRNEVNNYMNEDIKVVYGTGPQEFLDTVDEKSDYECLEMDSFDSTIVSKNDDELDFDPDSSWIKGEKSEPWWWTTDRDELAYMVAQKSIDHVENCDLPPPKKSCLNFKRHSCAKKQYYNDRGRASTFDSNHQNHVLDSCDFVRTQTELEESFEQGNFSHGSQNSLSNKNPKNFSKTMPIVEDNTGKAELMDALLHSQTRAREAENAAKQAYVEKEHILELFFKQASQLFAYRQWFQLLQLESLQIKNNDPPMSTLFPLVLPWMSCKNMVSEERWPRFTRQKRVKRNRHSTSDISTYAVAFALGLSLVSAGLLLGWTVGWMFPPF